MNFFANKGYQGACYQLDSNTVLTDDQSIYYQNKAVQGGVTFAINDSIFTKNRDKFIQNLASEDGSVLYALYNSNPRALSFIECEFTENSATQNMMQLMSS